jgi:hypothetical protein
VAAATAPSAPADARPVSVALDYAARGWAVIPLHTADAAGRCSCRSRACRNPGKHPRTGNGVKDRSTDSGQIRRWWSQWPEANVGVATGADSGLVVLDVDMDKKGFETLDRLQAEHGPLPTTPAVLSGGGGYHLYLRHPGGRIANSVGRLGQGLDLRGDGGYVVAPPSVHASGEKYVWAPERPCDLPLAPLPAWLRDRVGDARRSATPRGNDASIPEGCRNDTLTRLAGRLRRDGLSEAALNAALQATNAEQCDPPLDEAEVAKIAERIARYPTGVSDFEREIGALREELGRSKARVSAVINVAENPHLREQAPIALRIATLLEHAHQSAPTADGYYRVSDAMLADVYARDKPIRSRSTINRIRKQLVTWGLFDVQPRAGTRIEETVNPETGEIGSRRVPTKETWVRRDRPLLEKLQQLAAFVRPERDTRGGTRTSAHGGTTAKSSSPSDGSSNVQEQESLPMSQFDTDIYVTTGGLHPDAST